MTNRLRNYIFGQWREPQNVEFIDVVNPATQEVLGQVPLSDGAEVTFAVAQAQAAQDGWRRTPVVDRVQHLYKFKQLLEARSDDIAKTITRECGKTFAEAKGELKRGIENVEVACGMPMMMQGLFSEDIASGVDETMIRQPLGVVAAITPFNFPAMIPLWFLPYAIACGNAFILKPSEKVPLTAQLLMELIDQTGLPPGVVQMLHGTKSTVGAMLSDPHIRGISFVGSSAVARFVYAEAARHGKRVQCQGGAKNPLIILPDADLDMTTRIVADSAFGCAGQRCLAASIAVTVGDAKPTFEVSLSEAAKERRVGFGLEEGVSMGPVISKESKARIEVLIEQGTKEGGKLLVDGRSAAPAGFEQGNFIGPTVLNDVDPEKEIANTEIFGPVLSMIHVETIDQAIELVNKSDYGNMACLFTKNGSSARKFRYEAKAGNIGINLGVAAPMAFFPFSGWKGSFFGDLHAQGRDAVDFYTDKKVIVERWPKPWTRKF